MNSGKCEVWNYEEMENGEICIKGLAGLEGKVEIPEVIDGKKVGRLEIGMNSENIEEIVVPDTVSEIGSAAFLHTTKLKKIHIGAGVTCTGSNPFEGCWELQKIEVDEANTAYFVQNNALYEKQTAKLIAVIPGCESFVIPDFVKEIGAGVFMNNKNLKQVVIGSHVSKIGSEAFMGCVNLLEVQIPESVEYIDEAAFFGTGIREARLPNTLQKLGAGAFDSCKQLETVVLPEEIEAIPSSICGNCPKLKTVEIPASVTEMEPDAFKDSGIELLIDPENPMYVVHGVCIKDKENDQMAMLNPQFKGKKLVIPDGITGIEEAALWDYEWLEEIAVPETATFIGEEACMECSNLRKITIPATITEMEPNIFDGCERVVIYTPKGSTAEKYAQKYDIPVENI